MEKKSVFPPIYITLIFAAFFLFSPLYSGAERAPLVVFADKHQEPKVKRKKSLPKAEKVLIVKSERKLYLLRKGKAFREFHVALGRNPEGPKRREGDRKTPEGNYTLDFKKKNSDYYRAIHISYPGPSDRAKAKGEGVSPGGAIMIHGQPNWWGWFAFIRQRFDWTAGCIAVSNGDMDDIWDAVDPGTPVEIRP